LPGIEQASVFSGAFNLDPRASANLISYSRVGSLHHRYDWQEAARAGFRSRNVGKVLTINTAVTDTTEPTSFETSPLGVAGYPAKNFSQSISI
jgi:hypothetical protein